jgi:cold shock CspA family protein
MSNDQVNEVTNATGKIIYIEMPYVDAEGNNKGGYGFITSSDVPLTRIFFHWTSLVHNTVPFTKLKKDMKVEFVARKYYDKENNYQGYRASKVKVIHDEQSK